MSRQKTFQYIILVVFLAIIFMRQTSSEVKPTIPNVNPSPAPIVIPDKPVVPVLETNFIYDDFEKALDLAKLHKRYLIVVFGADWCPYCNDLKRDAKTIKEFEKYIVCFLDTDNKEKNQDAINLLKPKHLPTSLLVDTTKSVLCRKTGYRNKDYVKWVGSLEIHYSNR